MPPTILILYSSLKGTLEKRAASINSKKTTGTLAETVEDADNPEDKFRTVYSALYNSAPTAIDEFWASLDIGNDAMREVTKELGQKLKGLLAE